MEVFKEKRKDKHLRLQDIAETIKVPRQRISLFEKGEDSMSFKEVLSLCRELGFRVTISDERTTFDCK